MTQNPEPATPARRAAPNQFRLLGLVAVVGLLGASTISVGAPLPGANRDLSVVCTLTSLGYLDRTASANDAMPADVSLANNGIPPATQVLFLGLDEKPSAFVFDVAIAGTSGTVQWYYWKGSINTWDPLSVTDNTNHFKTSGVNTVSFTPPADWTAALVFPSPCDASTYWVKVIADDAYLTQPLGTQISANV